MKQYWFFAINCLINIIFCAVDGAFGNSISIDAVVVMGSFTILENFGSKFLRIGCQAYKVLQKNEKSCCILSVLMGTLLGVICVTCAYPITFIFELTEVQREMLRQALICYGLWCPIEAVGRYLQRYALYKCYNRLNLIANIATYILLITTDWLVIHLGWGINGLISSTGVCWMVYAIILVIATKFFGQDDKITFSTLKQAFLKGKDIMLGGIVSRFANLCFGHFASTMGTAQYAIHSVALSIVNLAEEFRDAECDYVIVRLKNRDKHKGQKARRVFRQCVVPSFLLPIIAAVILTLIMHGKVNLPDAFYGVALYCMPFFLYPVYDLLQQFTFSRGETRYAVINSGICAFWRIVVVWLLSILSRISVPTLGLIYLLDYASRTLSYLLVSKRDANRRKA